VPDEGAPDYSAWSRVLIEQVARLGNDVILVGYSVGATIVVWSLAANQPKQKPAAVFLIAAAFVGEGGWKIEDFTPLAILVPNFRTFLSTSIVVVTTRR
jgi:predicted alpha/beta hydrolase family esterase